MPAGAIETGRGVLGFGRRWTPREMALSAGERGVEKDWAAPVDVAAGGSEGEDLGVEVVRERLKDGCIRKAEARWRQRWQIMTENNTVGQNRRGALELCSYENVTVGERGSSCRSMSRVSIHGCSTFSMFIPS